MRIKAVKDRARDKLLATLVSRAILSRAGLFKSGKDGIASLGGPADGHEMDASTRSVHRRLLANHAITKCLVVD